MTYHPCNCEVFGISHQLGVINCEFGGGWWPGDSAITDMAIQLRKTGRSQADVCRAVGISPQYMSRIFGGVVDPSFQLARRLWKEIMK